MVVCRNDAGHARSSAGGTDEASSAGWNAAASARCVDDGSTNHWTAGGCCSSPACTWSVTLDMSLARTTAITMIQVFRLETNAVCRQLACRRLNKPDGRLPVLYAKPIITFPATASKF